MDDPAGDRGPDRAPELYPGLLPFDHEESVSVTMAPPEEEKKTCLHCGRGSYRGFAKKCPHCYADPKTEHKKGCSCEEKETG